LAHGFIATLALEALAFQVNLAGCLKVDDDLLHDLPPADQPYAAVVQFLFADPVALLFGFGSGFLNTVSLLEATHPGVVILVVVG
jgi:hypothetical protein